MFKKDNDPWVRTFTVTDPIKHKKGYTLYKVISKVFPKNSIEAVTQVTVWKRYSDFKNLHKALSALHQGLYLKGTFPPFAKAQIFGRFNSDVIEERRRCALELLEFAAKYPPLFTSQVFVKFFETGHVVDLPPEPEEEKCEAEVLQPVISTPSVLVKVSKAESVTGNQEASVSGDNEENELLGGIWKHRQVGDDISLNSHTTEGEDEEDDHTTFTDEDPSKSVSDLSEFDPLADLNASGTTAQSKSEDLCRDWLLSAFESFGNAMLEKNDKDSPLEFPKPFSDIIDTDVPSCSSVNNGNIEPSLSSSPKPESNVLSCTDTPKPLCAETTHKPLCDSVLTQQDESSYVKIANDAMLSAEQFEKLNSFHAAFTAYKDAAETLLVGAKAEVRPKTRHSIQKLIMNCLENAERIYNTYFMNIESSSHAGVSGFEQNIQKEENAIGIRRSIKDLAKYRVIGVLSKILLVLDVITNITCVVKVLRKSPEPQKPNLPNIAPRNLDFIVQLYEVYETTDAIFLILEYASGGRLWDYISSYLQRSPLSPTNDSNFHCVKGEVKLELNNVYSGKKLNVLKSSEDADIPATIISSLSDERTSTEIFPSSYAALFRNYAANVSTNNVSLAKCRTKNIPSMDSSDTLDVNIDTHNVIKETEPVSEKENRTTSVNNDLNNPFGKAFKHNSCDKNGIVRDVNPYFVSSQENGVNKAQEFSEHPSNKTVKSVVSEWLNSCEEQNNNDVTPSKDLCTFLSGSAGKTFINQDSINEDEEETLSNKSYDINLWSQKKIGFTEVFHKMDKKLSLANSKPTYLPESCIAFWAAEIVIALESLHKLGIVWKDLRPENILLGSEGHILLSYQSQWNSVDRTISQKAIQNFYAAPEVCSVFPIEPVCDWWSLGAILFELITGRKLMSCYPSGITSHTSIQVPNGVSAMARDILQKLLKYNSSERLGSGEDGIGDIKCHPFFHSITWDSLKSF